MSIHDEVHIMFCYLYDTLYKISKKDKNTVFNKTQFEVFLMRTSSFVSNMLSHMNIFSLKSVLNKDTVVSVLILLDKSDSQTERKSIIE